MCNSFRLLEKGDIECRVAQAGVNAKGGWASILLYKDARVDQRIMDDTFGPMNWTATYELIEGNLFCKVGVWDKEKGCWVYKMNVGTESNTEKEKGQASDALKRACFTWGLGVELYSAPKIFVTLKEEEYSVEEYNGKKITKVSQNFKLTVDAIDYTKDRKVSNLVLKDKDGQIRYSYGSSAQNGPKGGKETKSGSSLTAVFTSLDGKKLKRGDATWKKACEKVAEGEACNDGTPIDEWLKRTYFIPDDMMKVFYNDVNFFKNKR